VNRRCWTFFFAFLALATPAFGVQAAEAPADIPITTAQTGTEVGELYVWGRREGQIGAASSASEGEVSFAAYADRPLLRPGELAEVIPGLAVTQHSGSGKANQYFLRGFNLDHGTDFSVSLDGAPLNLRTHAHGQGYLDLNEVTPEFVQTIDYRKGPYFAPVGDFSAAGSAGFRTFETLPTNFIQTQGGENGFVRLLGGVNMPGGGMIGADFQAGDGPWVNKEHLRKGSVIGRFQLADWSVTALGYDATWRSTDQIPLRAVESGELPRLGSIDPTDGGRTSRLILAASRHPDADSDLTLYVQKYRLKLWSNFTYFLNDPVNGDQFEQAEDRWVFGGSGFESWRLTEDWSLRVGAETRYDRIGKIGLYQTKARVRLSTDRQDRVGELSGAIWGEIAWASGPLRATFGLRTDDIYADVGSDNPLNSGSKNAAFLSPKLTLAYLLSPSVELYADLGRSFHSNDARGAVARVAPVTLTPVDPSPLFAAATGGELGARYEHGGLTASAALWALKLKSELVYSGDVGDTESTSATTRVGLEMLLNWRPRSGINLDFSGAVTRARYDDDAAGGDRIPNALDYVLTAGATVRLTLNSSAELTVRRLGPAALVEGNSARSPTATVANLSYNIRFGRTGFSVEGLNVFGSHDNDITYFYASRLPGEPAQGVDDFHFHPVEPRQLRAGVRFDF
jgi:hypothetical protein